MDFRISILALFAVLFIPQTAKPNDSKEDSMEFGGTAPPICTFTSTLAELTSTNMNLASGASNQIEIESLTDPNSSLLKPASIHIEILGTCNQTHFFTVMTRNGGLALSHSPDIVGGAFVTHLNYRTQVNWAGKSTLMVTDGAPGKKTPSTIVDGANSGPLSLQIFVDEAENDMNTPVVAGRYLDTLIVQIGAPL